MEGTVGDKGRPSVVEEGAGGDHGGGEVMNGVQGSGTELQGGEAAVYEDVGRRLGG